MQNGLREIEARFLFSGHPGRQILRDLETRERRRTFRLVVHRDHHRLPCKRIAQREFGECFVRVRIFIDEFIERLVLRFRLLVLEAAVQAPAHDQRPKPAFVQ